MGSKERLTVPRGVFHAPHTDSSHESCLQDPHAGELRFYRKTGHGWRTGFVYPAEEKAERCSFLTAASREGDISAMEELGHACQTGKIGVQDDNLAFSLLKQSAERGQGDG